MLVRVGLLGLIPFATAFAFARNGLRAVRTARARRAGAAPWAAGWALAAGLAIAPVLAQGALDTRTREALEVALADDAAREQAAVARLRPLGFWADDQPFQREWQGTDDRARRSRLERVWHDARGSGLRPASD